MKEIVKLAWADVLYELLKVEHSLRGGAVYGVPTGGLILSGLINRSKFSHVLDPNKADIILDDIEDSGVTKARYEKLYPFAKFISLYKSSDYPGKWLSFPWEHAHSSDKTIQDNITRILQFIGEDPTRDGLKDTPRRVIKSYSELYSGYGKDPKDIFTVFENDGYNSMVILKDIELHSTCEHHMLPFYGKAHVAYIPNHGKIVGISKLARLVDIFAKRLQVQERIGEQVTEALMTHLVPKGAACVIEAKHMCMCARGVGKQNSVMVTSSLKGEFMDDRAVREEFLNFIHRG